MAGFTDALRGDGLAKAHRALAGLEGDPLRLDHARTRFGESPPAYASNRSGTTTRTESPMPLSEEQQRKEERHWQLVRERDASLPSEQFSAQKKEERERLWDADPKVNWIRPAGPIGGIHDEMAYENVKKCWMEQGIWNSKWNNIADGRWKHEEPLEVESEADSGAESPPRPFSLFPRQSQPKSRWLKSDGEKRRIAERRAVQKRESEASRPYHQFVYQISKERERIQDKLGYEEGARIADINSKAYKKIQETWIRRGIWNKNWSILPGMSWKHEEPLEEGAADSPAPVRANPPGNGNHEEMSTRCIFGSPSPVELKNRQPSGALNISQQGPSTDTDSAGENGGAKRALSGSNSPRRSSGKQVLRPITGKALRPSNRKPSQKDGQPASASLGLPNSSKVSKAARKKRPGPQRRPNNPQKVSSGGLLLSSGVDAAEPQPSPVPVNLHKSLRMQPSTPSVAKDWKRITRSKSKHNITENITTRSSAKPQGIPKRPSAKTTRGQGKTGKE